jgi:hypothetical protein
MKIQFGTACKTYPVVTAWLLGWVVFGISWYNASLLSFFGESEQSILLSHKLNLTRKPDIFYCDLPYDDCLCSVLLNKSNISENCITYVQLVGSRVLPLISFFLQIILLRELFSLITDHRRVFIYVLWIAFILTFVGMIISIYWSSCSQVYITSVLFVTSGLLFSLSLYNLLHKVERLPSSSDCNQIIIAHRSEITNNTNKSWLELL